MRIECAVSSAESGGCSRSAAFWRNPGYVLRRGLAPQGGGDAHGHVLDAEEEEEEELMLAVTLCLRDRRSEMRNQGGGGGGREDVPGRVTAAADISYLQVGFSVLEPVCHEERHGDGANVGSGASGALKTGSFKVDCRSPLLLLPGQHRVCGTSLT